jgi:mercuric reductase
MNTKLYKALDRLKAILPLKERQEECSEAIRTLHQQILHSFVNNGRILTKEEMAAYVSDLDEAMVVLKANDMVVFSQHGTPVGAYPFTMEEREHKVQVNGHQVYAMCALDALAVSPMFGINTQITSRCRVTGDPVHLRQSGKTIENLNEAGDVHFGIIWGAADSGSSCAVSLCTEMIFLRDSKISHQWYLDDAENREVFSLKEALEFASRFFVPLMS